MTQPSNTIKEEKTSRCGKDETIQRHDSFGTVSVAKVTGHIRLFGSVLDTVPTFISLRVHRAERIIDGHLMTEHYHGTYPPVVEFYLSANQWAELVSSMNGTHVPCTLRSVDGEYMPPVPEDTKTPLENILSATKEEARRNLTEGETEFRAAIASLKSKIDEMGLTKKKTEELKKSVQSLLDFVNVPVCAAEWATTRLAEDTEKLVCASKLEMSAALESLVRQLGIEGIKGHAELFGPANAKLLSDGEPAE